MISPDSKDKQFVDLYNFWKLQYTYRNQINSNIEEIMNLVGDLISLSDETGCEIFKNSVNNFIGLFASAPVMQFVKSKPKLRLCKLIDAKIKIINGKFKRLSSVYFGRKRKYCNVIFYRNKLPSNCAYSDCHILTPAIDIADKINILLDFEENLPENYIDRKDLYIDSYEILTSSIVDLQKIYECAASATDIIYANRESNLPPFKNIHRNINLIESSKLYITQDNNLAGRLTLDIDISEPLDVTLRKISFLKTLKLNTIPTIEYLQYCLDIFDIDYVQLKKNLKSDKNIAFSPSAILCRAIGLWLFDNSYNVNKILRKAINKFDVNKSLSKAINKFDVNKSLSKAINKFHEVSLALEKEYPTISNKNLDKHDAQLRKFYARTEVCIDKNEVLTMDYK